MLEDENGVGGHSGGAPHDNIFSKIGFAAFGRLSITLPRIIFTKFL